jgi:BirA family biotin operon repressor/biotin-[acetyl-CoA-carboxylase] ligase
VVVGVGVNVLQRREDFPAALGAAADPTPPATSLWIEGHRSTRETVAAGFLNALEPLLELLESRGAAPVLEAWQARAGFWGQRLRVRTPAGALEGIARRLDPGGGLVLALDGGGETVVTAGDLEAAETSAREER